MDFNENGNKHEIDNSTGADLDRFIRFAQTCQIFSQKNFSKSVFVKCK